MAIFVQLVLLKGALQVRQLISLLRKVLLRLTCVVDVGDLTFRVDDGGVLTGVGSSSFGGGGVTRVLTRVVLLKYLVLKKKLLVELLKLFDLLLELVALYLVQDDLFFVDLLDAMHLS